jgi:predicted Rossmann fold flavoprotein
MQAYVLRFKHPMAPSMTREIDVLILGGGAAGLFCALTAGQRGRSVMVLDSSNKVGKKILMSGGGRCNFTNLDIQPENYLSANPHFVKSALAQYTQWDFIALVEKHGIAYHEKGLGELFCDESSKQILQMLIDECEACGVLIRTDAQTERVKQTDRGFQVSTSLGLIAAQSLVIATGGLSIPTLGSSGFGYALAEQFGLSVLPRAPGLVPFTFTDQLKEVCERLSGTSVEVVISVLGQSFRGHVLFTHRGLSGPAALQISSYWQPGGVITLDLGPEVDFQALLLADKQAHPKAVLRTRLAQYLPKSLVAELELLLWPHDAEQPIAEIPHVRIAQLSQTLHQWSLKPAGTEGYRTAEVTLRGISTEHFSSKTMACESISGLYCIGEVLDVTGHLGGYNFQWAWSSGYVAGLHV